MYLMQETAWNKPPSLSYDFLKIAICLKINYAKNLQITILEIHERYIHSDSLYYAMVLKFGL